MVAVCLSVVAATILAAQAHLPSAVIKGVVVDSLNGKPLARALVSIGQIEQTTNDFGEFVAAPLVPGTQTVRVRRVGYLEYASAITLRSGDTLMTHVALRPLPTPMAVVTIDGKPTRVPLALQGPYERAARGVGHFFTRQDIERLRPWNVASLLNVLPGVSVNDRGVTFQRCQAGLPSPTLKFGNGTAAPAGETSGKIQLWIDGYRVTGRTSSDRLVDLLANVPISQIEIIEIYPGIAQIPAEFLQDACAVIAIWLKRS